MYCTLGNIEFNLQTSPTAESDTLDISWVGHETINQPTKLQPTGRSLVERTLEIYLNQSFCKVEEQVKALTDAATNYDAMALVMGNGQLVGDFVITTIEKKTEQRDELGNLIAATLTIILKEYIAEKLQTEQAKANNNAFATGKKKGVSNTAKKATPANAPCKTQVSNFAHRLRTYKGKENTDYGYFSQLTDPTEKQNVAWQVRSTIGVVQKLAESMQSLHPDCLTQYNIDFPTAQLTGACTNYINAMLGTNAAAQREGHVTFQGWIDHILQGATAADSKTSTRTP